MNEILVAVVTAFAIGPVGYFAHVAQERYGRKHQHQADDIALMKELHRKLVEQRESRARPQEVARACLLLESEAVLLRHAKLRKRVIENLACTEDLWMLTQGGSQRDRQNVWIQDALDALAAIARGERLPKPSSKYDTQLFYLDRAGSKLAPAMQEVAVRLCSLPGVTALSEERAAWEAERLAKRGWRRFIPRRKARSEPAAG
ncbi:hypothetical protein [Streptomyces luteogriseus]|uniref:hypothetical protein n=1 Tax=Streptomyces luteogriseus TaxID=68233 RepID=UPI0036A34139